MGLKHSTDRRCANVTKIGFLRSNGAIGASRKIHRFQSSKLKTKRLFLHLQVSDIILKTFFPFAAKKSSCAPRSSKKKHLEFLLTRLDAARKNRISCKSRANFCYNVFVFSSFSSPQRRRVRISPPSGRVSWSSWSSRPEAVRKTAFFPWNLSKKLQLFRCLRFLFLRFPSPSASLPLLLLPSSFFSSSGLPFYDSSTPPLYFDDLGVLLPSGGAGQGEGRGGACRWINPIINWNRRTTTTVHHRRQKKNCYFFPDKSVE